MATQTELQQALALKKANRNMTVRDAVSQVKQTAPIANAPIAGQPPAITPLPTETQAPEKTTAQLNQEQLLRNQAKVQGEILAGTRPEVGTTPENAVTPTPTTPPVTTPVTTPTTSPEVKTPEVKKETKDTTVPPVIPKTVDGIYNAIASGQVLTDDILRTPQYKQAKQRFDAVGKFGAMTVQQLADSIKQGQITTSASSALANNPNYQLARQKVDTENKNKMLNNVYSTFATGKELVIENPVESISDKLISKYGLDTNESRNLYQEIVKNNTDVVNYAKQLSDVNKQIADTTKIINDGYKEIRKNYGGKLSASQLIAYMGSRFRDATELLSSLNTTKDYLKADLETASDLAMGEYNASIKDMERSDAIRNALFSAELGLYTEGQKLKLQADFAKQQAEQAMNDPLTAVTSLVDEYKKQGIPFTRSTQEMVREAQAYVAGGGNLADYLTQLQTTIQSKDEYKAYRAKQSGTEWQATSITRYNPSTGANESTPIFYRKKTSGEFEAVDLAGNPINVSALTGGISESPGMGDGSYATTSNEMRTDRNMNPTAFTTDIAKQAGLIEGVDYVKGDKFPGNSNLYTAKIIGDPIETSIRVIDSIGFKTKGGANRWTYTDKLGLNNETWAKMSPTEKSVAIKKMYQQEGGNGKAIGMKIQEAPTFSSSELKSFESFDGKTIPELYKTPADKQGFIQRYNEWRNSQGINTIKTGEDILKINLGDKATEGQKNAITYSARMLNALESIKNSNVEDDFVKLPMAQQATQYYLLPDIAKSQNQKEYDAYKLDFITAVLRKESGAAIGKDEYAREEKKYFPQPGDDDTVLTAKRNARNFRVKALLSEAGKDINGNLASSYYNPEAYVVNTKQTTDITSRIKAIREKTNK